MQVSAAGLAQKINLSRSNAPLKDVLKELRLQSGYNFVYTDNLLAKSKPVDIKVSDADLEEVLKEIFSAQPLTYTIDSKTVIVKPKDPTFLERLATRWASIDANGRVVDSENRPLPGASVKVKKTGKGVSTDKDGRFFLRGVEDGALLVVSFIGYLPKEVSASANMGNVVLEQSLSKLDEVQVIAYGTTTQRLSTGNVSTIKAEDIEKQPVNNPLLALAGRVPGLMITQTSGFSGGPVNVQLQGQNSIKSSNDPFYVIDGVPFPSQNLNPFAGNGTIGNGNPLSFLNPGDIESIDVLKDADATAIYGSRAANGAILITTKKGKAGQTKVDLNVQSGIGQVAKKLDLMNTQQYLDMRREAIKNDGLTIPSVPTRAYYDLTLFDQNRYTDWQKELIGSTARYTNMQTSVSGGNDNTQVLFSANYHKETDVFPGQFADKKGAVHFSFSNTSTNQKFNFRFTGSYMNDVNKLPGIDLTSSAIRLVPNAPALYDDRGDLNWAMYNGAASWQNPLAKILRKYKNETANLVSNAEVSYELLAGLRLKSSFGYNKLQSDEISFTPQTYAPPNATYNARNATYTTSNVTSWIIEPQLSYQLSKDFGQLDFLLGSAFQRTKNNALTLSGRGYSSDSQLENIQAATTVTTSNALQSVYNYNGLFGRINYNYQDKYILNFTARRDGSSRFGSENLFNNFYGVAGAWIFSNEKWFKEQLPLISFGKLKLSYGTSGSDGIGDYQFMSLYEVYNSNISYGGGTGLKPAGHANPYLQWEETRKLNAGLDLGILRDKVIFNLNYYRNRSSNQLLNRLLPIITGFGEIAKNFDATVQNSGYEIAVNTVNVKSGNFKWTSNLNFSINRNQLLAYENLESSGDKDYLVIGKPITIIKAYEFAGVNSQTGFYQFKKADGSLTDSPVDPIDKYVLINTTPKYFGGFNNSFSYKDFTLDFLFQFVKQIGMDPLRFGTDDWPGSYGGAFGNQPVSILNHWKQVNDMSPIQKVSADFSAYSPYSLAIYSDVSYVDASYIRLKNVSLSWSMPKKWANRAYLQNAQIYFQGQNLLTFTKYKGLDPESQALGLPPLRVLTVGVKLSL